MPDTLLVSVSVRTQELFVIRWISYETTQFHHLFSLLCYNLDGSRTLSAAGGDTRPNSPFYNHVGIPITPHGRDDVLGKLIDEALWLSG
jgi:hypothetical protein